MKLLQLFGSSVSFRFCVLIVGFAIYFVAGPAVVERIKQHEKEKMLNEFKRDPIGTIEKQGAPMARQLLEEGKRALGDLLNP